MSVAALRHDWTRDEVVALFALPFNELLHRAHSVHRAHHDPERGAGFHPAVDQDRRLPRGLRLLPAGRALRHRREGGKADGGGGRGRPRPGRQGRRRQPLLHGRGLAQPEGSRRGQRWPKSSRAVKALGLETCATLGMLSGPQAQTLKQAGLDYYNHNLDTAPEFYGEIIHTREYQDRLDTLEHVREAGMKTCCGGIVGMGETREQRAGLLQTLANLPEHPQSVPINQLVQVEGTPLHGTEALDPFEFVRTIAVARILMPASMVRLSAGRQQMDDAVQALCFFAGANSIFYGEKLLTTGNPDVEHDRALFRRLDLHALEVVEEAGTVHADIVETEASWLRPRLWLQCRGLTCSIDWPFRRPNVRRLNYSDTCARSRMSKDHGWTATGDDCSPFAATIILVSRNIHS